MGCCCSGEANAKECEIPPPEWGKPMKCRVVKKTFSADYKVLVPGPEGEEEWMLVDAVGSFWDAGFNYFLKHRAPGQVDEEGKADSTTLGSVNIKGDWDAFSFKVCGADRDVEFGPFIDLWDGDVDWGVTSEKKLWAVWTYSKRAVLFKDKDMSEQIGWLDITGSGTWYEEEETRVIHDTDDDGKDRVRYEKYRTVRCRTNGFRYKFNVFNCDMVISYRKSGGLHFWNNPQLHFKAANAWAPDVPLFTVSHDGKHSATIETFENSDPISTLLAAYAISCKLNPREFGSGAQRMCERYIRLGMPSGCSDFVGMPEADFERHFSQYPAPVPQVFVQAQTKYDVQHSVVMQPLAVAAPMMGG